MMDDYAATDVVRKGGARGRGRGKWDEMVTRVDKGEQATIQRPFRNPNLMSPIEPSKRGGSREGKSVEN